ncbi:MAG: hypothetical protein ACRD9Q_07770 [Nitrososphaeraceae archaeon]
MAKGDPRTGQGTGYFPAVYQAAASQSAEDYDSIMSQYKNLSNKAGGQEKVNASPISPSFSEYQPGSSYDYLRDFTKTGGYSDSDIGSIRSRAVSPIKSIYSAASRNVDRAKNLAGGYSPNAGAVQSKLARESSGMMSKSLNDVNANIAQMVQSGKLAGATSLAPLEARENELRNQINQNNANTANQFSMFNAQQPFRQAEFNNQVDDNSFDNILKTIQGQQSTYGTTPALANTFGNQVLNAANTANNFAPISKGNTPSYNPNIRNGIWVGGPVLGSR